MRRFRRSVVAEWARLGRILFAFWMDGRFDKRTWVRSVRGFEGVCGRARLMFDSRVSGWVGIWDSASVVCIGSMYWFRVWSEGGAVFAATARTW